MGETVHYDDVCRRVGRLYLESQEQLERLRTVYEARIRQLEEDNAALRRQLGAA